MKRIERVEEGYLINDFQHRQICKNSLALLRHSVLNLIHIGRISHKEGREIESFIDNIIYKDVIKKQNKRKWKTKKETKS